MARTDAFGRPLGVSLPPRRSTLPRQGGREVIPTPAASRVGRMLSPQHWSRESMMRSQAHRRNSFPTSARNRAVAGPRALQSAIQGLLGGLRPSGPTQQGPTQVPSAPSSVMTPGGPTSQPLLYQPNQAGAPVPIQQQQQPAPQFQMLPYFVQPTGVSSPYQAQAQMGLASAGPVRGMTVY